jgi:hypothetical protein
VVTSGSIVLSAATISATFLSLHYASTLHNFVAAAAMLGVGTVCVIINRRANVCFIAEKSRPAEQSADWRDLPAVAFLALLLVPSNLEAVTAGVLYESHKVSYFIGPALYANIPGLVPGLDFHSHYGVALGWFFHLIMGDGWKSAAERAVGLNIAITLAVYIQAYFLLSYLVRSRLAAVIVIASLAVLAFSTDHHFYSPSAYPTRFPLLIVFAIALGLHCRSHERYGWLLTAALIGAVSLLWETETGVFFLVTGAFVALVAGKFPNLRNASIFVAVMAIAAALSCLALFGPRALSITFMVECLRPLLLYGAGWGSVPIKWGLTWDLIYNFPLQIVGCITVGWAALRLARGADGRQGFVLGVLLALSLIGIALMIKWVNRSLDAVWHQNALPLVIVTAWWVSQFTALWRPTLKATAGAIAIVATVAALIFVQDSGNPSFYGLRSYAKYPSLLNLPFVTPPPIQWQEDFGQIMPIETAFIEENTKPDDRVLVIGFVDWAYLAQAHRAPKAYFLPLNVTFDSTFIQRSFDGADVLFYDKVTEAYKFYDKVTEAYKNRPNVPEILDLIARDFVPVETRGNLTLYKRKRT